MQNEVINFLPKLPEDISIESARNVVKKEYFFVKMICQQHGMNDDNTLTVLREYMLEDVNATPKQKDEFYQYGLSLWEDIWNMGKGEAAAFVIHEPILETGLFHKKLINIGVDKDVALQMSKRFSLMYQAMPVTY